MYLVCPFLSLQDPSSQSFFFWFWGHFPQHLGVTLLRNRSWQSTGDHFRCWNLNQHRSWVCRFQDKRTTIMLSLQPLQSSNVGFSPLHQTHTYSLSFIPCNFGTLNMTSILTILVFVPLSIACSQFQTQM